MADQLASGVEKEGAAAQGAVDGAASNVAGQVSAGSLAFDAGAAGGDVGKAQELSKKEYAGPAGMDEATLASLGQQADGVQRKASLLGSDAGRATLLAGTYGKAGHYGQGARNLDAFLAGGAGAQRLQQAQGAYGKMRDYLGVQANNVQAMATQAKNNTAAAASQYGQHATALQSQAAAAAEAAAQADARATGPAEKADDRLNAGGRKKEDIGTGRVGIGRDRRTTAGRGY